ncbi:uncharacterized protein LOC130134946 [Syzygium oleosum]|uniref:uncharacterized protein LOC130134946 n=1 Tax=Syzygium oleosum TaxID=219896 RepID=UPI0024BB73BB|nr:uncharacterized protein LOC130134946 [Syzygium oleosum]
MKFGATFTITALSSLSLSLCFSFFVFPLLRLLGGKSLRPKTIPPNPSSNSPKSLSFVSFVFKSRLGLFPASLHDSTSPIPRPLPVPAEPKSLWFPSLETTSFGRCSTPPSSPASGAGGAEIAPISFIRDDLLRSLLHLPHSSPASGAGGAEIAPVSFAREDLLRPLLLAESVLVSCLFFPLGLDRDSGANFEPASAQNSSNFSLVRCLIPGGIVFNYLHRWMINFSSLDIASSSICTNVSFSK